MAHPEPEMSLPSTIRILSDLDRVSFAYPSQAFVIRIDPLDSEDRDPMLDSTILLQNFGLACLLRLQTTKSSATACKLREGSRKVLKLSQTMIARSYYSCLAKNELFVQKFFGVAAMTTTTLMYSLSVEGNEVDIVYCRANLSYLKKTLLRYESSHITHQRAAAAA